MYQLEPLSSQSENDGRQPINVLDLALKAAGMGVWQWDARSGRGWASAQAHALLGTPNWEDAPSPLPLDAVHTADRADLQAWLAARCVEPDQREEIDVRIVTSEATIRWLAIAAIGEVDAQDQPLRITGTLLDITVRKSVEEDLVHQALHDPLTNLPNRTLLHDRLQQMVLTADRSGTHGALLLLDLNQFREVNDTLGHEAGDVLLQEVGDTLRRSVRASDTVARMGGDEFAVLLPGANAGAAQQVAGVLLTQIRQPFIMDGLPVNASVGVGLFPEHGADATTLLRRAEIALYTAKHRGEPIVVYAAEDDLHSAQRLTQAAELRRAIERGELVLHYQPKVDCTSGRPLGVEALVRWQHGTRLVPPDEFIPLAEQVGLIGELTRWVLDHAIRQCVAWRDLGLNLSIAVNISARGLHDPTLPPTVAALLDAAGLEAERLILEITEGSLLIDPDQAMRILRQLQTMGVRLSIDDFGTGYSSLAYLKQLPVMELKIDRSFIKDMVSDVKDQAIVRSTVELAHNLGLKVVAEGVEDAAGNSLLQRLACDEIQGFFFSRPLPTSQATRWLMEHSPG